MFGQYLDSVDNRKFSLFSKITKVGNLFRKTESKFDFLDYLFSINLEDERTKKDIPRNS